MHITWELINTNSKDRQINHSPHHLTFIHTTEHTILLSTPYTLWQLQWYLWTASTVTYSYTLSPCPSICIFKYTRKSRSITDANKLNECRKIHKYKIQSAHSLFSFKLKLKSRASPTSTSTSPPLHTESDANYVVGGRSRVRELAEEKQAPHQGEGESILKEDASLESTRRLFANTQKSEVRSGRLKTERQRRRRRFSLFCFPVIFALWKLHYKQRQRNNENKIKISWRLTKEYPVLKYTLNIFAL